MSIPSFHRRLFCIVVLAATSLLWSSARPAAAGASPKVEILRDRWGTPHIFAPNEEAGFFGLGYACAEDRMLQMDLGRRRASGRLAEVFGKESLDSDRAARVAGHTHYAAAALAALPQEMQKWLSAYAAGVNAWISAHPDIVARRFKPLGTKPGPWTPGDCLLAARGLLSLGSPFQTGAIEAYHRFREAAGRVGEAEALRQQPPSYVDDGAAIVPESEMAKDREVYKRLKAAPKMLGSGIAPAGGEGPKMSHAWAVSGRRSKTGKPILESDPQLTLSTPPFFYEFHLSAGRITARGLGLAGFPGLFIGFNRRIAWGATALGADSFVSFLDRLAPDGKSYLFQGKPVPFERRLELIRVKGGPNVVQEVFTNRHGTVFNSLVPKPQAGEAYVLHDPQTMNRGSNIRAMLSAMTASNWKEFRAAWEHYYDPGIHAVYADVDDNLGYHTLVHRPLTARAPNVALEGWTGRQEITGRIPFGDMPHMINPGQGFISHANNMPVGSWYPYQLGIGTGGSGHTNRSLRLVQLLTGDRKFSVEDFEAVVHRDDLNAFLASLLPMARKVVEEDRIADPEVLKLLEAVKGWNAHAGTVHERPAARSLENALTPYRRSGLQAVYGAAGGGIANLVRTAGAAFARDGATPKLTAVRAYLVDWLRSSAQEARKAAGEEGTARRGPDPAQDSGRTMRIPYQKSMPVNFPVVDASLDIVSPPLTCLDVGTIWSQPGNLYTQIVDLSDPDNSRAMIAPGNSEEAESPFRTAGIEIWVKGGTRPAPLSRGRIEGLGTTRTTIEFQPYQGPRTSQPATVDGVEAGAQFVPAIPPAAAPAAGSEFRPPGRKPDDPRLEAAFRVILRAGTAPGEIDEKIAECRELTKDDAGLREQLLDAARLGIYLIEESSQGRLKVQYGSPHALRRLKELLGKQDK